MYVILNVSRGLFLSSMDIDFLEVNYTNDFDKVMLFDTEYQATVKASYVDEKVAVLKICNIF